LELRHRAGGSTSPEGGDLDQYGRGEYDEATGLYEWYDLPPERAQGKGQAFSLTELLAQRALVVADFASEYGVELETWAGTWRMFLDRLTGLLHTDSRLARHFQPKEDDADGR
jgi:hypothetical protein